jgi:hypothetical protein
MPKKLPHGRAATADRIAALLRIYRAAARAGDDCLRDASASELRTKYRIEVTSFDLVDLANASPPIEIKGGKR